MSLSYDYLFKGGDTVETLRLIKGSSNSDTIQLPWLDMSQAIFIAVNRVPGDDIAIALDYRLNSANPRIVASDWRDEAGGCVWKEVYATSASFASALYPDEGMPDTNS